MYYSMYSQLGFASISWEVREWEKSIDALGIGRWGGGIWTRVGLIRASGVEESSGGESEGVASWTVEVWWHLVKKADTDVDSFVRNVY